MQKIRIKAKLKTVSEVVNIKEDFNKVDILVETENPYSEIIPLQVINEDIEKLKALELGNKYNIDCLLKGSKTNEGKHFVNINAFNFSLID